MNLLIIWQNLLQSYKCKYIGGFRNLQKKISFSNHSSIILELKKIFSDFFVRWALALGQNVGFPFSVVSYTCFSLELTQHPFNEAL
jgi:hypothetical protein